MDQVGRLLKAANEGPNNVSAQRSTTGIYRNAAIYGGGSNRSVGTTTNDSGRGLDPPRTGTASIHPGSAAGMNNERRAFIRLNNTEYDNPRLSRTNERRPVLQAHRDKVPRPFNVGSRPKKGRVTDNRRGTRTAAAKKLKSRMS